MISAVNPTTLSGAEPYNRKFFDSQAEASLRSARIVLSHVFRLLQPSRVLDVGCGVGPWLLAAMEAGAHDAVGLDGDYVDRSMLMVEPDRFIAADLASVSLPLALGEQAQTPFDLAMCLEVAEHLPFERAPSLVEELCGLSDVVLFSAAVPFQFGTEHINEQWPDFWSILFRANQFVCFDPLRPKLWSLPDVDWWYSQNVLLFAKEGSHAASRLPSASLAEGRILSLVHPENLLANLLGLPRRHRLLAAGEEMADLRSLTAANKRKDTKLPHLAAVDRALSAAAGTDGIFPVTRMETYQPERDIAELEAKLAETGAYLEASNGAFAAERAKRFEVEAALGALRPEYEAVRAAYDFERRLAAQAREEAERLSGLIERSEQQGVALKLAEVQLADFQDAEAERRRGLEQDLSSQREALQSHVADFEAAAAAQQAAIAVRGAELEQHAALLVRMEAEINAFAADTHALRASRTWRYTRRLLQVMRRLPKTTSAFQTVVPSHSLPQPPAVRTPVARTEEAATLPSTEKYPIKRFGEELGQLEWWTMEAAITRLRRLDVFNPDDYLSRNPDVAAAGLDPYAHFIQSGALEGRGRIDSEDLARLFGSLNLFDNAARALHKPNSSTLDMPALIADVGRIDLYVSTFGNVFMNDIAEDLAADLRSAGVVVRVLDERADVETRSDASIYIAPHEFFTLGDGPKWVRDDVLSQGFMFGTEQLQTTWFNTALPFVLTARGMLDICVQTVEIFKRLDMASLHVLPGARQEPHRLTERDRRHPLYGVLPTAAQAEMQPSTPFADRPIDVSFFGSASPRRDVFFAQNAAFFSEYETFNYCRRPGRGPIRAESEDGTLSRMAGHVCGHSKISLNIHREEFGYFEWHRMVRLGMCAGSLVVSDPCLPHPNFVADRHYLQEDLRHMPELLDWLLKTPEGAREAERVRSNVNRLLTDSYDVGCTVPQLLHWLQRHRYRKGERK